MDWTESSIARTLVVQFFKRKHLVVVPNCNWTGHECDLLCVTNDLRIIDVEIKISRGDLRADAKKEKWWHRPNNWAFTHYEGRGAKHGPPAPDVKLSWPPKIWKHYYAMPAEIWTDDLKESMASDKSGVLLLRKNREGQPAVRVVRPAKPIRDAEKIGADMAINIARLASLRMWDAKIELDELRARG
jgi:hypothetical protein